MTEKTAIRSLKTSLIDEMSDGQWHPLYKIKKALNVRSEKMEALLRSEIESLVDDGSLIAGNNNSFRMEKNFLKKLHIQPELLTKKSKPRFYGGILEDDGWLMAPLKEYDMVHFRMDNIISSHELRKHLKNKDYYINIDNNTHLVRVFAPAGTLIRDEVISLKETVPELGINSVRLETNLRRRMLSDLPPPFIAGLCEYYGKFARVLLRSNMSSVKKHIKEQDDIQQQIYLWVIEAVQRYDAETSIPFAAYLSSSLRKWVFNLARESYGRAIADAEIKHARIINAFIAQHGREPSMPEISKLLGETEAGTAKDKMAMANVSSILNTATINHEDGDLQIMAEGSLGASVEELAKISLISAAILAGARKTKYPLVSLLYMYYKSWGSEKVGKKISNFLQHATVRRVGENAVKHVAKIMKED
jgi:DNA-directed RNA polymerase specialized sigma subunit